MTAITMRLDGEEKVLAKLDADLLQPAARTLLKEAIGVAHRTAIMHAAPADQGKLVNSMQPQIHDWSAALVVDAPHAATVDKGRRAGARPPPTAAIAAWLSRRGGDPAMAFVVARSIGRRGIKGRHFMQAAEKAVEAALPRLLDEAGATIGREWGA